MAIKLTALLGILNGNDGSKARAKRAETNAYQLLQRVNLFNGFRRTYAPRDEENGEVFPDEVEVLQHNVEDVLADIVPTWAKAIDDQTSVDMTNGDTTADLVFEKADGSTLNVDAVPVVTLLWLEKQLDNAKAIVEAAPVLNATKEWTFNTDAGYWVTEPRKSIKTRKVPKALVLYPATDKHAAQVQAYNEDEPIGDWTTVDHSGALSRTRKRALLERIAYAKDVVKTAREQANATAVVDEASYGRELLEWLLGED